ncbi:lachesin [Eurytemora carolleeae]|uniref:lachesin n=1 Tax=Eurytemora carolleeae TaxID=1294199 RepID=UPI000C779451|nr:lachesin [Eurytemora carolleeae]|eukprot:XP_023319898.1 lachesin-like [Eurytemora affinis]
MILSEGLLLFISFVITKGSDIDDYTYPESEYHYEDYNMTGYYEDGLGSGLEPDYIQETEVVPAFIEDESRLEVDRGNTARLVCTVSQLGSSLISWKRVNEDGNQVYLSMGDTLMIKDRRMSVVVSSGSPASSTLTIALVEEKDTGDYECEVSSIPPINKLYRVEMRSPPRVKVQGVPESGNIVLNLGDTLYLTCQGFGDPAPSLHWFREHGLLPTGEQTQEGERLAYSSVRKEHSGTYGCTGNNGFGQPSTQLVTVRIKHEPEVVVYKQVSEDYIQLTCKVESYPEVNEVVWSWSGGKLQPSIQTETVESGNHILNVVRKTQKPIGGTYTCIAENIVGKQQSSEQIEENNRAEEIQDILSRHDSNLKQDFEETAEQISSASSHINLPIHIGKSILSIIFFFSPLF